MAIPLADDRTWAWLPLVVGLLFPPLALALIQSAEGEMLRTVGGYFTTVSDEPLWVVPGRMLWNLLPFAALFIGAHLLLRTKHPHRVRAASLFGMLGAMAVFVILYSDARSALDAERWTASAIATGMAPLYALPVALVAFGLGVLAASTVGKS
jgi:hypothetical protein